MDAKLYKLAAQFKIKCKKSGFDFEIVRFIDDREYARQILSNLDGLEDEETMLLGLVLRDELGFTPAAPEAPAPKPAPAPEPDPLMGKYRYGARG